MKTDQVTRPERVFQALSAETRLRLLHLLTVRALSVSDASYVLDLIPSTLKQHLMALCRAGLVETHKDSAGRVYGLIAPHDPFHVQLLACLATCVDAMPILGSDRERLRQLDLRTAVDKSIERFRRT